MKDEGNWLSHFIVHPSSFILSGMRPYLDADERHAIGHLADLALALLALVFLGLLVVEFTVSLSPVGSRRLHLAMLAIWAIFAVDFFVRWALADSKLDYLRRNWLSGLAITLPAFRAFRVLQALRIAGSVPLTHAIAVSNRGTGALRRLVGAGGAAYIFALTAVILVLTAVGMYVLERRAPGANITSVAQALWWSAATLTTVGSELYPVTEEGRILAVLLMLYGLGFAGYITATLAALLLGRRQDGGDDVASLREEVRALRRQLEASVGTRPQTPADGAGRDEP